MPRMNLKLKVTLALILITVARPGHAIEEPAYEVTAKLGEVEVRQYPAYAVAEVVLTGSARETGNKAFRILAGYIFGKNKSDKQLAMTAPVTQIPMAPAAAGQAATASGATGDNYLVQFVLPKDISVERAPPPLDPRIVLREEPPRRVAVIRYAGLWSDANYNTHLAALQETLRSAGVQWSGAPIYSRYNPPFTPWFLRRNEIWLELPAESVIPSH